MPSPHGLPLPSLQILLDVLLLGLLAATLARAMPLQRALGRLASDRAALDALLADFAQSTRNADHAITTLRGLTDHHEGQSARAAELATALRNDLGFLIDRGDLLADRLDALIRTARPIAAEPARHPILPPAPAPAPSPATAPPTTAASAAATPAPSAPRARSQAERDLLAALRTAS